MRHFIVVCVFAAVVGVVFGGISQETPREQIKYGLKVFAKFAVFAFILGWVLFFIP